MGDLPLIKIGDMSISKVICGTNPFFGFSHFTRARDMWLREHFTNNRIRKVIGRACDLGVNAVISGTQTRLHEILDQIRKDGHEMHWICTPGGETTVDVEKEILWCRNHDVEICMPHQMYTDHNLVSGKDELMGYDELSELIRSCGMVPGLSTHRPVTIVSMDRAGKDIETYVLPFNTVGFLSSVEVEWVRRVINNSPKPIIAIKPLAAGRLTPEVGLPFVLRSIKEKDAVAVGFCHELEVEEDIEIVKGVLFGDEGELPLTTSRSKSFF